MGTITDYEKLCAVCNGPSDNMHHLIFGRGLRKLADEDGLVIPLCIRCHNEIHSSTAASKLSRICGQLAYEKTHSRQDFIKRYGRSYI